MNKLADTLNLKSNSLNVIRLVLALLVVVFHSFPLGGFQGAASIGQMPLGTFAVASFFVVSGYLISHSRSKSSTGHYFWKRGLRIIPAYLFAYLMTAFVFSFIVGLVSGGWSFEAAANYVIRGLQFFVFGPEEIGATLIGLPYPLSWNGSMWSVRVEALLYVATALAFSLSRLLNLQVVLVAFWASLTLVSILIQLGILLDPSPASILTTLAYFVPFYLAGSLLYLWRGKVSVTTRWILLATVAAAISLSVPELTVFSSLPLGYLLLVIGSVRTPKVFSHLLKNDYSYGVYVLAFPIQQTLSALGVNSLGLWVYMAASLLASLAFALVSWHGVESPALRLKGIVANRRQPN